jgi:hypothetical protein
MEEKIKDLVRTEHVEFANCFLQKYLVSFQNLAQTRLISPTFQLLMDLHQPDDIISCIGQFYQVSSVLLLTVSNFPFPLFLNLSQLFFFA